MADHDPFPMRSEEACRLAASVQNNEEDPSENSNESWHKMATTVTQKVPDASKTKNLDCKESLVTNPKEKVANAVMKQMGKPESIYDRDDMDEMHGRGNDRTDEDDDDNDDDFFDAPVRSSRIIRASDVSDLPRFVGSLILATQQCYFSSRRVVKSAHRKMYGDTFPWDDFIRTIVLSSTLFVMIGGYWLLRSLKDPVLTALCGVESIPKAKMLSVFVVLGVVAIYNHLLDDSSGLRKEQLFYIFGTFYGLLFTCIAYFLDHPTIGLANQAEDPARVLGWVSYCGIESFGSVMVSLFWSFANSNFNLKQAKRSYGMMVATAQLGSILGPTFVNCYLETLGIPTCYMVGASCMLTLQLTMWTYVKMYGVVEPTTITDSATPAKGDTKKLKSKAGILEGIHLFMKHNYIKGIFAISCLFMVEVTIIDYTLKVLARDHYSSEYPCRPFDEDGKAMSCWDIDTNSPMGISAEATKSFSTFMGFFGQATNTLSFFLSFFGTSAIIRVLGLRTTLLLFPSICLMTIITVRMYPTLNVVFAAMIILKANSYALNNPTKEILYQPTSSNVKYKAKSWIDIFGARGSKALGSVVTNAFSSSTTELIDKGSIVGMCVATFLIWNARFMGKKFDDYTSTGYVVGETKDDEFGDESIDEYGEIDEPESDQSKDVVMASRQNEIGDTSCAFYDDDEVGAEEEGQSQSEYDDDDDTDKKDNASSNENYVVEMV